MTTIDNLTALAATATDLGAEYDAHQEAIAEERAAEAALLDRLVEAVRPALRALASKVRSVDASTSGRNGCNPISRHEYFGWRGCRVAGEYERRGDGSGNRGRYGGSTLYLAVDGTWRAVDWDGQWSQWQGEWDRREGEDVTLTTAQVVASRIWTVDEIVAGLRDAMERQLTRRDTAAARARAAKLRALTEGL